MGRRAVRSVAANALDVELDHPEPLVLLATQVETSSDHLFQSDEFMGFVHSAWPIPKVLPKAFDVTDRWAAFGRARISWLAAPNVPTTL